MAVQIIVDIGEYLTRLHCYLLWTTAKSRSAFKVFVPSSVCTQLR